MKKHLLILLIGCFITAIPAWAENVVEKSLVFSTILYGNENDIPLNINSDQDWTYLSGIDTSEINSLESPADGVIRKWRVKSSYSDETIAGQSTVQIKLRTDTENNPLFTLPWSEGKKGWKENYSNWFQTEFNGHLPLLGERSVSSVRLIAPPGSSSPGMIYKIELEAWDIVVSEEKKENLQSIIQKASMNVIPEIKAVTLEAGNSEKRLERKEPDREQALSFALTFINDSITGNLPAFYSNLNNTVYSLKSGEGDSKFRVKPPQNNYSGLTLSDYTEIYETKIYEYSEYSKMFPQWLDENRKWNPARKTYLYHGSALKEGKEAILSDEILVFMCEQVNGEWKLIAVPE
ncbi:MAG: hypothetical protein PF518_14350 [Spirochaetaceae bacterium]|nr:hypothetical protein [Spirochaetaceae bacterium]